MTGLSEPRVMNDNDEETGRLEAAALWYGDLQAPDVDLATWDAFRVWERDPRNAAAFRQIEASVPIIDRSLRTGTAPADVTPVPAKPRRSRRTVGALLVTAAAVLALGAALLLNLRAPEVPSPLTYASDVGEQRSVTLIDGSVVTLNTDTAIAVLYTSRERHVSLERGQALFEVARTGVPFVVEAGASRTRAIGTAFEVYLKPSGVAITLLEGSVHVTASEEDSLPNNERSAPEQQPGKRLAPGDRLSIAADGTQVLSQVDITTGPAWRQGIVQFDNVTLEEAAAELNRYSDTKIIVPDARLASERISGTFQADAPADFAANLVLMLPVAIEEIDRQILLVPSAPTQP